MPLAFFQPRHKIDFSKPLYAEDVHIGKKITVDYIPRAATRRGGKPNSTTTSAATGILGEPVAGEKYAIVIGIQIIQALQTTCNTQMMMRY